RPRPYHRDDANATNPLGFPRVGDTRAPQFLAECGAESQYHPKYDGGCEHGVWRRAEGICQCARSLGTPVEIFHTPTCCLELRGGVGKRGDGCLVRRDSTHCIRLSQLADGRSCWDCELRDCRTKCVPL